MRLSLFLEGINKFGCCFHVFLPFIIVFQDLPAKFWEIFRNWKNRDSGSPVQRE